MNQNIGGTTVAYEQHSYNQRRPFSGQSRFLIFLDWLEDLKGTFAPIWPERSAKRSGRRDPDKHARRYPVGFNEKYWEELGWLPNHS
jgi:hypothetical protein